MVDVRDEATAGTEIPAAEPVTADPDQPEATALKEPPRKSLPREETLPKQPNPPAPAKRSTPWGGLVGGVLAAGIGYGVAQVVPNGWPIQDTAAIEAQLAAQAKEIAALKADLAGLPAVDPSFGDRIAALESAPLPPDADLSPLTGQLAAIDTRLAAIESLPMDGSAASPAALAAQAEALRALQQEVQALKASPGSGDAGLLADEAEARLKEAEAQALALKTEAEAIAKAATSRAALGRMQAALDSGLPYGAALDQIGVEVPAVLKDHAAAGLPTLGALQSAFPDAARAALDAALRANMGESWTERVGSFLRTQTGVRSLTPREGADPDAVLSRASAAVDAGDLPTALTEIAALPEVAQTELAAWRALAEQRLAGAAAIADLASTISQ